MYNGLSGLKLFHTIFCRTFFVKIYLDDDQIEDYTFHQDFSNPDTGTLLLRIRLQNYDFIRVQPFDEAFKNW